MLRIHGAAVSEIAPAHNVVGLQEGQNMKRIIALTAIVLALGFSRAYPANHTEIITIGKTRCNAITDESPTRGCVIIGENYIASTTITPIGDNDDVTSDDWRRWCGMEGVKDPLWDCDALRRGEIRRRHMEKCSADYAQTCEAVEHETDWLRGPKR
jgi:hypothetical protein